MDLGAPPLKTFFLITLPIIAPAVVSGWLLAFTLRSTTSSSPASPPGPGATHAADADLFLGPPRVTPEINAADPC